MTERKPPEMSFETWIDRQIREAAERGEFADLPGAGKPIPDLHKPHDDNWWIKRKLQRENLSYLPPTLALRKEVADELAAAKDARSEEELRRILAGVNERIREAIRAPLPGPPLDLTPVDIEEAVAAWRADPAP
jgi:Domain of unknown function (DUF1992)